jgi:hypothetical protein
VEGLSGEYTYARNRLFGRVAERGAEFIHISSQNERVLGIDVEKRGRGSLITVAVDPADAERFVLVYVPDGGLDSSLDSGHV